MEPKRNNREWRAHWERELKARNPEAVRASGRTSMAARNAKTRETAFQDGSDWSESEDSLILRNPDNLKRRELACFVGRTLRSVDSRLTLLRKRERQAKGL